MHGPPSAPTHQLQHALYQSIPSRPISDRWDYPSDGSAELTGGTADRATNIYFMSQYQYQISLNAVSMADNELGLLLPRSGRIWFNARLFSDVPRGRELATRDVWWRVIDASPAIRFLLGWSISLYRIARFQGIAPPQLPGWSRQLYFSPTMSDYSKGCIQLWSDVICDVTELFVPRARVWRQLKAVMPTDTGDSRWGMRRVRSDQNVEALLRYLADQNNCPVTLVHRSLDGNPPISTFEEYVGFTEAILYDMPRLQMQRTIAMRNRTLTRDHVGSGPLVPRVAELESKPELSEMPDPRQRAAFWQLHL